MHTNLARNTIFNYKGAKLYSYNTSCLQFAKKFKAPILVVYALVNSTAVLDLHPNRSWLNALLTTGADVYLLEWPQIDVTIDFSLEDYILDVLASAVNKIYRDTQQKLHLVGVCQGGYFTSCYASCEQQYLKSLIPIVTPFDFAVENNRIYQLLKYFDVELIFNRSTNIPGHVIVQFLQQLAPFMTPFKKLKTYIGLAEHDCEAKELFQLVENWSKNSPNQARTAFGQFLATSIQQNALIKANLRLLNQKVDLANIKIPILNIYAEKDHIWPIACVKALCNYHGSCNYREYSFNGGHIGVFISSKALLEMPKLFTEWLQQNE